MKYFRTFPWGMQLLMFLLMIITMLGVGQFSILYYLAHFTTYTLPQLAALDDKSPLTLVHTSLVVNGVLSLFMFLSSALLFAYFTTPRPAAYLGLKAPGKKIQPLLAVLVILGAMPLLQLIETGMSLINFGPSVKAEQAISENTMNAFLNMPTFGNFLLTFTMVAIVPAFGEELFFRGVMMRFAKKRSRTMVLPVLFTSVVFAYAHANPYGLLSIFLAGVLLAVIYYLTGSLWCSIAAHLSFNGFQIVMSYLASISGVVKRFSDNRSTPVYMVIAGAVLFSVSFYLLLKNKTPLPDDWAEDFTGAELAEANQEGL